MLRFTCLALLVTVAVGLQLQAPLTSQWLKFKSAHRKTYSGSEEIKRQTNFKKNVQAILEHNLEHDFGEEFFTLGVNEFSDMDHDEFVSTMCGLRLPANYSFAGREVLYARPDAPTAAAIDWRTKGVVTPVENQGSCGSCWTFTATGTIEGAYAIKYGIQKILSEQHLLDCASNIKYPPNDGCKGGLPNSAMDYILDNGGINEAKCYGNTGVQQACKQDSACNTVRLSKYVDVRSGDVNALLQAVNIGPVSAGIDAGQADFQSYKSGVYAPSSCSQLVNHAVLVVGYGNEAGRDYWLAKNSWGTTWGDQGYIKIIRNNANTCGIANVASYAVVA